MVIPRSRGEFNIHEKKKELIDCSLAHTSSCTRRQRQNDYSAARGTTGAWSKPGLEMSSNLRIRKRDSFVSLSCTEGLNGSILGKHRAGV